MNETKFTSILIILGLVAISLPFLGLISSSLLTGVIILLLGINFLIYGISVKAKNTIDGIILIIEGVIAALFGACFLFIPTLLDSMPAIVNNFEGIFLVIVGIATLFTKDKLEIIYGILQIVIGALLSYFTSIANPALYGMYLGIFVGLYIILTGMVMFLEKKLNEGKIAYN